MAVRAREMGHSGKICNPQPVYYSNRASFTENEKFLLKKEEKPHISNFSKNKTQKMRIASNRGLQAGADDQIQKIMYERLLEFKILCEAKDKEIHDPKKNEANKVRITTTSHRTGLLITTLEIFSENDPFFHYRTSIDVHDFQNIKTVSNLAIEFNEYPD